MLYGNIELSNKDKRELVPYKREIRILSDKHKPIRLRQRTAKKNPALISKIVKASLPLIELLNGSGNE